LRETLFYFFINIKKEVKLLHTYWEIVEFGT